MDTPITLGRLETLSIPDFMDVRTSAERVLGRIDASDDGPILIFLAGVHGNETSAIEALEAVWPALEPLAGQMNGSVLAVLGNRAALEQGRRFIDEDLNRIWTPERLQALETLGEAGSPHSAETREQIALLQTLHPLVTRSHREVFLIDLHTTSAESAPFIVIGDTIRNRRFALKFHSPIILGLEERLRGTLLHYAGEMGIHSMAFEAGQHEAAQSLHNHIAAIWIALVNSGCLPESAVPDLAAHEETLQTVSRQIPRVFEFIYHYPIQPGERFRMEPGFVNFQPVPRSRILAHNGQGPIRSPYRGNVFMPLYQDQGSEGFFIIRPVNRVWLGISLRLRQLRLDRLLPHLPGIHRHPRNPNEIVIDRRVARWLVVQLCHLLGYRRKLETPDTIIFIKRPFDLHGPGNGAA